MSIRKLGIVLAVVCASAFIAPVAAEAQTTPSTPTTSGTTPASESISSFRHVPITGTAPGGQQFTGRFNVSQFVSSLGRTYAVGTVVGKLGTQSVTQKNVMIPVKVDRSAGTVTPAATCSILHLVLGPLNLNLLGLKVHLNTVVLNITAVSGPGNLLGNLLCGVAHLLDGSPLNTNQVTSLLNVLQQVTNAPGLLTL